MANQLNEMDAEVLEQGREINVINKQIKVEYEGKDKGFEILMWCLLIIPGIVFYFRKIKAKERLVQLEQKIQHDASQIDNYLEQRVTILQNAAQLVNKAIKLDKETFSEVAKLRSGNMNETQESLEKANKQIAVTLERYPELQAHKEIEDAMQQNSYLQKEVTAARDLYNNTVNEWNSLIFQWPTYKIVAAKNGYTTRIPFVASKEVKEKAKGTFFE